MAATLQRKSSGGIIFVIITKIITKEIVPRNYFVIISARMVVAHYLASLRSNLARYPLLMLRGFQREVLFRRGISTIGVVRAPVAVDDFSFFLYAASLLNPIQSQKFLQGFDAKIFIATGARTTPIIEISSPSHTPPLKTPDYSVISPKQCPLARASIKNNRSRSILLIPMGISFLLSSLSASLSASLSFTLALLSLVLS